jgi:hypothetical protein
MKQIAIDKARKRLQQASDRLERAKASANYDDFESAWGDFLVLLDRVRSSLKAGAKENPTSRQWFGGWEKNKAAKDPLLAYLQESRNTDEHTTEPIATHVPGGVNVESGGQLSLKIVPDPESKLGFRLEPIVSPGVTLVPSRAKLVTVKGRFGAIFDPPTQHLGTTLTDTSPVAVGALALIYYADLIDQAQHFVI